MPPDAAQPDGSTAQRYGGVVELQAPADVLAMVGDGANPEAVGVFADRPVVAVAASGRDTTADLERCAAVLATLPCVSVVVDAEDRLPAGVERFDIALTGVANPPRPWVAADVHELVDAVHAAPEASVALAQLLRLGDGLDVRAALVAESLAYGLLQSGPAYRRWLAGRPPPRPRPPVTAPVLVDRIGGGTLVVTLNQPEVHNAYSAAIRDELCAALAIAATDPSVESVELRGNGPTFSSGGDLREFGTVPDPVTGHLVRTTRSAGWWMHGLRDRLTVHVHGRCAGAGVELPAFAAKVHAAAGTTFRLPEVGMGLVPGAGGTASIPTRIGRQRTAWLAITGTELDLEAALRWGLVDR
jgi:hypothetical protein